MTPNKNQNKIEDIRHTLKTQLIECKKVKDIELQEKM